MLGFAAGAVGAIAGAAIGIALSLYVALLDLRKREAGIRSRAEYRGSLVLAPVLLALIGWFVTAGFAHLF
jgi:hypothetical protein